MSKSSIRGKVFIAIEYLILFIGFMAFAYFVLAEVWNEEAAKREYTQKQIQQCIDMGGDVEVRSGWHSGWTCHVPNEELKK